MDKIIPLNKGIHRQPSVGADGELSELVNLIPQNGELVNVRGLKKGDTPTLSKGERFVKVHQVQGADNYVVVAKSDDNKHYVKYYRYNGTSWNSKSYTDHLISADSKVEIVGNTLMVLSDEAMYYYLWKGTENGYAYLGDHLPELPIAFGLQSEMVKSEVFEYNNNNEILCFVNEDEPGKFSFLSNKTEISNLVIGKVNEFINKQATGSGRFMFPFFVRYAYRLYDGSLTMHSAPALMVCSSDCTPRCFTGFTVKSIDQTESRYYVRGISCTIAAMLHQLDYEVMGATTLDRISPWKDIVKSVDVFVSSPIKTFDQNGECEGVASTSLYDSYSICKNIGQKASTETYPLRYQKSMFSYLYAMTFDPVDFTMPMFMVQLPYKDEQYVKKEIAENSLFYHLTSISIDDLKTDRTILPISKEYLQSLTNREVMTDDYISHDKIVPQGSYIYNARLNLFNVKRNLFGGFRNDTMQSYSDGYVYRYGDANPDATDYTLGVRVYYHIRQDGNEFVVWNNSGLIGNNSPFLWLYHPNSNVYRATIEIVEAGARIRYNVRMEPHPLLGGSYYFAGWGGLNESDTTDTAPIKSDDASVTIHDTIFSSEVNNPFHFSALGSYTIGTDRILGVSTAAKALSQGQFGQFPLYAFCSDGIWALEVSGDGTFSAKQPISRDVCKNPDSITQIDDSVIFSTDQGLKIIQGSTTALLSAGMDGYNVSEGDYFPQNFFRGHGKPEYDMLVRQETRDFREILKTCRIAYDYANQLLRIFPDAESGSPSPYKYYVYSLTTHEFSTVIDDTFARKTEDEVEGYENVSAVITDYPSSLVQIGANIYQPMTGDREGAQKGILLTRPIALDEPFALKKLQDMRLHYSKFDGTSKCHVVVYASNDSTRWWVLNSLRKRAFKFYRFAIITDMKDMDALSGMVLRYEIERNNKLR